MPEVRLKSLVVLMLLLASLKLFAQENPTLEAETNLPQTSPKWLKPYSASYNIYRGGDVSGSATRSLKKTKQVWELLSYSKAKVLFFTDKRTEKSEFIWNQNLQPISYLYEIKNSFKKQLTKEFFDWELKIIRGSRSNKNQWQIPLKQGVTDPLSHQLLLREKLIKLKNSKQPFSKQNFTFNVTSKGTIQQRSYQLVAEETITTQAGDFDTYKLVRDRGTRKTILWMAIKLDFIPVKIYQEKDGDEQATMAISKIEFPAQI
jgi:hypothetical protein